MARVVVGLQCLMVVCRLRFGMVGLELFWVVFGFRLSNVSIRSVGVGDWLGTDFCFVHCY